MSTRWTLATQPSQALSAAQSPEGITALTAAYELLREIARRPSPPDADGAQDADENRAVDEGAEEIAA